MEVEQVIQSIDEFFGDKSRSPEQTKEGLGEIVLHAETCITALTDEEKREQRA